MSIVFLFFILFFAYIPTIIFTGEVIPLAAVGVMSVIKPNGTVVAYNRYIKMTNSGRLHALNVGMSSRAAGRALARERKRRTDALANSTDRVFDSNAYVIVFTVCVTVCPTLLAKPRSSLVTSRFEIDSDGWRRWSCRSHRSRCLVVIRSFIWGISSLKFRSSFFVFKKKKKFFLNLIFVILFRFFFSKVETNSQGYARWRCAIDRDRDCVGSSICSAVCR